MADLEPEPRDVGSNCGLCVLEPICREQRSGAAALYTQPRHLCNTGHTWDMAPEKLEKFSSRRTQVGAGRTRQRGHTHSETSLVSMVLSHGLCNNKSSRNVLLARPGYPEITQDGQPANQSAPGVEGKERTFS